VGLNRSVFEAFMGEYLIRRRQSEAQDVYKLLYQGVYGVEHIMGEGAWERLVEEADRVKLLTAYKDPLVEPVSVDGALVRVNLRPYVWGGGSLDELFAAMKKTMGVEGSDESFYTLWGWFKELYGFNRFNVEDVRRIDEELKAVGPRPKHHSERYREAYYPAYRVVKRSSLVMGGDSLI
jgi:hypothetical protein